MRRLSALLIGVHLAATGAVGRASAADEPPTEWVDAATGHRIVRLSREPGSASLYFHQNAYTPDGRRLLITTPDGGLSTIDLQTRVIESLVPGRVNVIVAGHKTGQVYYLRDNVLYTTDVNTRATRRIADLPPRASLATVNADETLLAGVMIEGEGKPQPAVLPTVGPYGKPFTFAEQKEVRLYARLEQRIPMALFTLDTRTGKITVLHRATDWLNHLQFSPTDPGLLMFCHEGPWHRVDRIWTIRTDGTGLTCIHTRTINMEIAGHEFFGADGKTIWYDLQTPRGEDFWLAGYNGATGERTHYYLQRNEWSVHFNVSPDGTLFAGDGGDNEMVARAPDGKWIYLFRPETIPDVAGIHAPNAKDLITPGVLRAERLVNMANHDYRLEPNVTFTPDQKWIVFRSNLFGPTHVFAVEIAKANPEGKP